MKINNKLTNLFLVLGLTLSTIFCFTGCTQEPSEEEEPEIEFKSGWWKYTLKGTDFDKNWYFYYNEEKKITKAGDDEKEFLQAQLEYVQQQQNFSFDSCYTTGLNNEYYTFTYIEDKSKLPIWATFADETDNENTENGNNNENGEQRQFSYISLMTPVSAPVEELTIYDYAGFGEIYSSDEFEVITVSNENNIEVDFEVYANKMCVIGHQEGTIVIKIRDKTANCESNECEITFSKDLTEEESVSLALVGKWKVEGQAGVYDTIEFYSDGTGKLYLEGNEGNNTFRWSITEAFTLSYVNTTMNLNIIGTSTYSLDETGTKLTLTNFIGYENGTSGTYNKVE